MFYGSVFRQNFDIYHMLPDPASGIARDIVWVPASRGLHGAIGGMFFRLSENRDCYPEITKADLGDQLLEVHAYSEIEEEVGDSFCGHRQYHWVRPRRTWLDAACPVYIDLGDDLLVKLEIYDDSGLPCVRFVPKSTFVVDAMSELAAQDVGKLRTRAA